MGNFISVAKFVFAFQLLIGVVYTARSRLDLRNINSRLGLVRRVAKRSISQHDLKTSNQPIFDHSESGQLTEDQDFNIGNIVRSSLARNLKRKRRTIEFSKNYNKMGNTFEIPKINFGMYPIVDEKSMNDDDDNDNTNNIKSSSMIIGNGIKTTGKEKKIAEFFLKHITNKSCVLANCGSQCNSDNVLMNDPDCFDCINANGCLRSEDAGKAVNYQECGEVKCSSECENDWSSEECGNCLTKFCGMSAAVTEPATPSSMPARPIMNEDQQCINKCQNKNSCDNEDLNSEKNFRQCSSECHINYDNIKEARECINNSCNHHISANCRTCLDVCVLETLVLGYYRQINVNDDDNNNNSIQNSNVIKEFNHFNQERLEFINNVLPKYQDAVNDQEISKSNNEKIDYDILEELDSEIFNEGSFGAESNTEKKSPQPDKNDGMKIRFSSRSQPSVNVISNSVNTSTKEDDRSSVNNDVVDALADIVRSSLKPKERLKMYTSARAAIKQTVLQEKRRRTDLIAALM